MESLIFTVNSHELDTEGKPITWFKRGVGFAFSISGIHGELGQSFELIPGLPPTDNPPLGDTPTLKAMRGETVEP